MQRIKRMKDKLIEEAQNRLQNMGGGSIEQMSQIIDMIKDLSGAEKSCLEAETETTYGICERLACLYTVRDHLKAKQHDEPKSSEFLTAAVGVPRA